MIVLRMSSFCKALSMNILELEGQSNSQKDLLYIQKRKIEDAKGILCNALHNLQQIKETKCSTDVEKNYVSKLCLQKFKPLLHDLCQIKGPATSIVEYVQNETFIKSLFSEESRLKVGHFETLNVSASDFELMPEGYLKLDSVVSFKVVFSDLRRDMNQMIKYFRWKVEVNGSKVETHHSFFFKTFKFEFLIREMNAYTVSFHLLNEHVSGSPFSFMPFSASSVDILNDDLDSLSNPPNTPGKNEDALYKVIPRCTPEKSNCENCNHARFKNTPSPGTPLRRPFLNLQEDKNENGMPALVQIDVNFDFDFHPSLASTGTDLISQNLNNLNLMGNDSSGFDRSGDQSTLKPGFKTILMDQVIIKKNGHDESDSDFGLKFNSENKPSVIRNLSNSDWDVPFNLTSKPKSSVIENKKG
ncbi:hypothetical protein Anas_13912, partial [Armadillidium nasatum]